MDIERNIEELSNCAATALDYYLEKDYDNALCCIDDLLEIAERIVEALEELDEGKS